MQITHFSATPTLKARSWAALVALLALLALLAGCGSDTPPYQDLPLRDALNAAPEVLAAMPEDDLRDVAQRFEEAHAAASAGEETSIDGVDIPSLPVLLRGADALREEEGKDAVVLGAIDPLPDGFVLRLSPAAAAGAEAMEPLAVRALKGEPATSTASLEDAALRGRAGVILADLAKRAGAHELIRITGMPAGVIAMDGSMYVNASWLVALSALSAPTDRAPPAPPIALPPLEPKSVRANPYKLPASILECAADVQDVCTCASNTLCDHDATDPSFGSGQAECEWVNADRGPRSEALCVLALLSIEKLRDCVASAGSACAQLPVGDRASALAFVADVACMDAMDLCLRYGKPRTPVETPSSGGGGSNCTNSSCSDCDSCNSCDECDEDQDNCNQNCAECNENCDQCNENCRECDENYKSCNENCRVSARRRPHAHSNPTAPPPLGTLLCLLAPIGYILRRSRSSADRPRSGS
jgi:hypothetical protein